MPELDRHVAPRANGAETCPHIHRDTCAECDEAVLLTQSSVEEFRDGVWPDRIVCRQCA